MDLERLSELLAEFCQENPHRPLVQVTCVEFALWFQNKYQGFFCATHRHDGTASRTPCPKCGVK